MCTSGGVDLQDLSGLRGPGVRWWRSSWTPQTVIGAVEVETTGTGRIRWTAGLVETAVETTETGRWPDRDHRWKPLKGNHKKWIA